MSSTQPAQTVPPANPAPSASGGVIAPPPAGAVAVPIAGAAAGGVGGVPAAGSGTAGTAGHAGALAHPCSIPNEIMIEAEDLDGGVAPDCQNVPRKLIANNCIGGICHDMNGPAGGLDLMSPCVAERLVNVKSHCDGTLLINTAQPEQSFLSDKLNNLKPRCGYSMPDQGHLPADELQCMNAWIAAVIRAAKALPPGTH